MQFLPVFLSTELKPMNMTDFFKLVINYKYARQTACQWCQTDNVTYGRMEVCRQWVSCIVNEEIVWYLVKTYGQVGPCISILMCAEWNKDSRFSYIEEFYLDLQNISQTEQNLQKFLTLIFSEISGNVSIP